MPLSYLRPGMITIKTNYEIKTMLHIVRNIKTILSTIPILKLFSGMYLQTKSLFYQKRDIFKMSLTH